jgi:hypothetical protein
MVAPNYGPGAARRAANSFFLPRFYRALACGASMKGGTTGGGFAL